MAGSARLNSAERLAQSERLSVQMRKDREKAQRVVDEKVARLRGLRLAKEAADKAAAIAPPAMKPRALAPKALAKARAGQ